MPDGGRLPGETCWTVVRGAADGDLAARDAFAAAYLPVVRDYLSRRWRASPLAQEIEDAVQEVFVDLLRADGALARVDPERAGGFRAFLWGVTSHTALHFETRLARRRDGEPAAAVDPDDLPAAGDGPSVLFDRAWARAVMEAAAARQVAAARASGGEALKRCEILRLRFEEGLRIREVAARWGADPDHVHHEYARARDEFREALRAEVGLRHPGTPGEVDRECARLLSLL
jgi:RNA polymerase sigma-70 factor (ECF subfamily)